MLMRIIRRLSVDWTEVEEGVLSGLIEVKGGEYLSGRVGLVLTYRRRLERIELVLVAERREIVR